MIRVRDNGVGIAPELLPKVFELFTQVDGSLGRTYGGLGIGLALARNLVEMQDGRLRRRAADSARAASSPSNCRWSPEHRPRSRRPFWNRANEPGDPCGCWWWRITSMPPTA